MDYLCLSFINATAFSPTDILPLSRWVELTMLVQSLVSFVTVALVIARAVNILQRAECHRSEPASPAAVRASRQRAGWPSSDVVGERSEGAWREPQPCRAGGPGRPSATHP